MKLSVVIKKADVTQPLRFHFKWQKFEAWYIYRDSVPPRLSFEISCSWHELLRMTSHLPIYVDQWPHELHLLLLLPPPLQRTPVLIISYVQYQRLLESNRFYYTNCITVHLYNDYCRMLCINVRSEWCCFDASLQGYDAV